MAPVRSFEDLDVFERAYALSIEVHRLSLTFPDTEKHVLGDQVRRASRSICANIAEGFGKQRASSAEFKRFLRMAIGSADEMRLWCMYCRDLGYVDAQTTQRMADEFRQIAKMLQGLHTKSGGSTV